MAVWKGKRDKQRNERLEMWQRRLWENKAEYEDEFARMRERDAIYNGTNEVDGNGVLGGAKAAGLVYNAAYELIEGQVDSSVPMPRVSATAGEDAHLAGGAEDMLRMKLDALPFEEFNDMNERNTYNQGGDFALVEWDNSRVRHSGVGDIRVTDLHPLQVVPQSGVLEIEDMDYIFVRLAASREAVKARYGVWVEEEFEEDAAVRGGEEAAGGMLTVNTAYYKNGEGGIGRYVWANGTELESLHDYEARRLERCLKCGEARLSGEEQCPQCGGKRFAEAEEEFEEPAEPVRRSDGSEIAPFGPVFDEDGQVVLETVVMPDGSVQLDEGGRPVLTPKMERVRIPYYKPGCYPVLLRRNVSKFGSLLGSSDIDVIRPQQDAIKKLASNVMEKLLKGGSYVTLPAGVRIETSERQLKVLRIDNPAQKALIDVLNIQPNISFDMVALTDQYEKARSALGITKSFQGKPDETATSGVAKQFAAAQTAGRLESKRRMKGAFYQRLFEVMFKFMLAYADGPVRFRSYDERGNEVYAEFNRYDYLKRDEAGQWYWQDEFMFGVDAAGGLAQNREAMWAEAEKKYTSGAMGEPASDETRILYWTLLEQLQFPLAKAVKRSILEGRETKRAVARQSGAAEGVADVDFGELTGTLPGKPEEVPGKEE